jgi:hypothetical protein
MIGAIIMVVMGFVVPVHHGVRKPMDRVRHQPITSRGDGLEDQGEYQQRGKT